MEILYLQNYEEVSGHRLPKPGMADINTRTTVVVLYLVLVLLLLRATELIKLLL